MNLNLSPSPFPMEQMKEKEHDEHQQAFNFDLNHQIVSSSSASCHIFFNPSEDHMGFYRPQLHQPQGEYYGHHRGSSSYEIENKVENGVKLSVWKNEEDAEKWICSKMKKHDRVAEAAKIEVKKVMPSSSVETDLSSSYNCKTPIRVCSDCHTTKTPLWRSGPKGPKSLCNACGIRQRKARRAMAAAANGGGVASSPLPRATKVKEKMGKSGKRCKLAAAAGSSNGSGKKIDFEDFLINLSNKLALIHRVFPQDEKEAAILLMALSSGLVHG